MTSADKDQLLFADEQSPASDDQMALQPVWNILVVDDEMDVHQVTKLSLKGLSILGRKLHIVHADSAGEAEEQLKSGTEFAAILLDVVMETEDAGLQLVKKIRDEMHNHEIRIILRTGQPGQAPEAEAISNYDINDYRLKTELTRVHLVTSLTAAIRSFQQIRTINKTSSDLGFIVSATNQLLKETSLYSFGIGVLDAITGLLDRQNDAFISRSLHLNGETRWVCFAGTGIFSKYVNKTFSEEDTPEILAELEKSCQLDGWVAHDSRSTLKITTVDKSNFVFTVDESFFPINGKQQSLDVLVNTIAVGLENQSLMDNLSQLAWKDGLTHLPNRAKIMHILETVVMDPGKHDLYMIDVDDFDVVNDGLGQDIGDQTLIEIGKRLSQLSGDSLVAARLSGDSFAILGRHEELSPKKVASVFDQPFYIAGTEIRLQASLGLLHNVNSAERATVAARRATLALHKAKKLNRGNYREYDDFMESEIDERLDMVGGLQEAIKNQGLCLHYQPKVNHSNQAVVGMEALMRWPQEDGFIPPFKFIPVAESSGLIFELEKFLVDQACIDIKNLDNSGFENLSIAINVSTPVMESDDFFEYFCASLDKHQVSPKRFYIELTESMMINNPKLILKRLTEFRELGCKCSLDDFGTGFNSLSNLNILPIDQLKIDKSFVDEIHQSEHSRHLNESIIQLAKNLNLEIVAEGVEYQEQYDLLTEIGCEQTQGYLFSKPLPVNELIPWLKQHTSV